MDHLSFVGILCIIFCVIGALVMAHGFFVKHRYNRELVAEAKEFQELLWEKGHLPYKTEREFVQFLKDNRLKVSTYLFDKNAAKIGKIGCVIKKRNPQHYSIYITAFGYSLIKREGKLVYNEAFHWSIRPIQY